MEPDAYSAALTEVGSVKGIVVVSDGPLRELPLPEIGPQ